MPSPAIFKPRLLQEAYSEALIQGNLKEDEAKSMVKAVDKAFKYSALDSRP